MLIASTPHPHYVTRIWSQGLIEQAMTSMCYAETQSSSLAVVSGKWLQPKALWRWWNLPEYVRNCTAENFQFIIVKTVLIHRVFQMVDDKKIALQNKILSPWGQTKKCIKSRKSLWRQPISRTAYLYIYPWESYNVKIMFSIYKLL